MINLDYLFTLIKVNGVSYFLDELLNIHFSWNIKDYNSKIKPIVFSYHSIHQYYLKQNVNINIVFSETEKEHIINLIKTLDILNLELVKQILIIKIRCIISN